jgi:hypothetical protein
MPMVKKTCLTIKKQATIILKVCRCNKLFRAMQVKQYDYYSLKNIWLSKDYIEKIECDKTFDYMDRFAEKIASKPQLQNLSIEDFINKLNDKVAKNSSKKATCAEFSLLCGTIFALLGLGVASLGLGAGAEYLMLAYSMFVMLMNIFVGMAYYGTKSNIYIEGRSYFLKNIFDKNCALYLHNLKTYGGKESEKKDLTKIAKLITNFDKYHYKDHDPFWAKWWGMGFRLFAPVAISALFIANNYGAEFLPPWSILILIVIKTLLEVIGLHFYKRCQESRNINYAKNAKHLDELTKLNLKLYDGKPINLHTDPQNTFHHQFCVVHADSDPQNSQPQKNRHCNSFLNCTITDPSHEHCKFEDHYGHCHDGHDCSKHSHVSDFFEYIFDEKRAWNPLENKKQCSHSHHHHHHGGNCNHKHNGDDDDAANKKALHIIQKQRLQVWVSIDIEQARSNILKPHLHLKTDTAFDKIPEAIGGAWAAICKRYEKSCTKDKSNSVKL